MWWHGNNRQDKRGFALWMVAVIVVGIIVVSNRSWGWGWWWIIFIVPWFLGPKIWRHMNRDDDDDKPKRDFEKPKRSFTRDDGEQLEIIEEAPGESRSKPDDIEYV